MEWLPKLAQEVVPTPAVYEPGRPGGFRGFTPAVGEAILSTWPVDTTVEDIAKAFVAVNGSPGRS